MKSVSRQGESTSSAVREILVVDSDPRTSEVIRATGEGASLTVRAATSLDQAALEMKRRPADMVVVNLQVNDNQGLDLLRGLREQFPRTETVAFSRLQTPELCLGAWRAGATDMLLGIDPVEIKACLDRAAQRRAGRDQFMARHERLRTVCRNLNKARHEISQQVNLLCHDLVRAYQDLAEQLNQTQTSGEFSLALGDEVEIESLMRRTMEWVLKKLGPVNAAVYLPDSEQNFTLGAYLNFDTNADSMLIDVIGQTVVPQSAEGSTALLIEDDKTIHELFGDDGNMLAGRTWLGCGSFYHNECLAVIVVFRSRGEAIDPTWGPLLESVAPVLAEKIARSIRVYQRGLQGTDESGDEAGAA